MCCSNSYALERDDLCMRPSATSVCVLKLLLAYSNSYALERDYGWRGICVEPQALHWRGLLHRKCTGVAAVVSDTTGAQVMFLSV